MDSSTRQASRDLLEGEMSEARELIQEGFDLMDDLTLHINEVLSDADGLEGLLIVTFGAALVKGRRLLWGMYQMIVEGLAQESGALYRPIIETNELIEYVRKDHKRANEFYHNTKKPPTAGTIGMAIDGWRQDIRNYLNEHASHVGLTAESLVHFVDIENQLLVPTPGISRENLTKNLTLMNAAQTELLDNVALALREIDSLPDEKFSSIVDYGPKCSDIFPGSGSLED